VELFEQINNAVLDLQRAQLQTYARPLKSLGRLLQHDELHAINSRLLANVNLDDFLARSKATGGSMVGSQELLWPDDPQATLGLTLALVLRMAEDADFAFQFSHTFFYSDGRQAIRSIQAMVGQMIVPFARDYRAYALSAGNTEIKIQRSKSKRVFVVHGHDGEARETVARFLSKVELEPVILHEQPNRGRTIIEKVEANADVGFAVILLTPDDVGRSAKASAAALEPRARQNVLLELGYFMAKLGRENVCALKRGAVEIPTDIFGVVWTEFDDAGGWRQALARELNAAGYQLDWNRVMN
jgi:predicted nucleotide-binding protein